MNQERSSHLSASHIILTVAATLVAHLARIPDLRSPRGQRALPLGGSEDHKGYGLSVIIEILSGILTGLGFGVEASGRHNDGCFISVFNVAAFRPLAEFKKEVTEFTLMQSGKISLH